MMSSLLVRRCITMPSTLAIMFLACSASTVAQTQETAPALPQSKMDAKMDAKIMQLQKTDTTVGTGAEAVAGKIIVVHYTGWLYDPAAPDKKGRKFDSSLDRHSPFSFPLGGHQVIRGWDEGVVGMRVGGKRELVIPSEMAYGGRGAGGGLIPPNATLVFDIELLDVKDN